MKNKIQQLLIWVPVNPDLGFMIYDLLLSKIIRAISSVRVIPDLIEKSKTLAQKSQFNGYRSRKLPLKRSHEEINAAFSGVRAPCLRYRNRRCYFVWMKPKAEAFALVPCCQAEVSDLLDKFRRVISEFFGIFRYTNENLAAI